MVSVAEIRFFALKPDTQCIGWKKLGFSHPWSHQQRGMGNWKREEEGNGVGWKGSPLFGMKPNFLRWPWVVLAQNAQRCVEQITIKEIWHWENSQQVWQWVKTLFTTRMWDLMPSKFYSVFGRFPFVLIFGGYTMHCKATLDDMVCSDWSYFWCVTRCHDDWSKSTKRHGMWWDFIS